MAVKSIVSVGIVLVLLAAPAAADRPHSRTLTPSEDAPTKSGAGAAGVPAAERFGSAEGPDGGASLLRTTSALRAIPKQAGVGTGGIVFNGDSNGLQQNEGAVAACIPSSGAGRGKTIVVGGANDYRGDWFDEWGYSGFYVSVDGGKTILAEGSVFSVEVEDDLLWSWGDPSVAFDASCNLFYGGLHLSGSTDANVLSVARMPIEDLVSDAPDFEWLVYQGDTDPDADTFEDKPFVVVDPRPLGSAPLAGAVYVVWTHFTPAGETSISVLRCLNGIVADDCDMLAGTGTDTRLNQGTDDEDGEFAQNAYAAVDKNGNIAVVWTEYDEAGIPLSIKFRRAEPDGEFGSETTVVDLSDRFGVNFDGVLQDTTLFRVSTAGKLAVDKGGALVVAWEECAVDDDFYYVFDQCADADVYAVRSTDGGSTWSSPARVGGAKSNDYAHQFLPWIAADPVKGGFTIVYYTTAQDAFNSRLGIASASSKDGATFAKPKFVTKAPADPVADLTSSGGFIGDYIQATVLNGKGWVHFTGTGPRQRYLAEDDDWDGPRGFHHDNILLAFKP